MQSTYLHRLQYTICNLPKCEKDLSEATKYVCYSELLKQSAFSFLQEDGRYKDLDSYKSADSYCASDIYSIVSSYNKLEEMFEKLYIIDNPILDEFNEARSSFMENLPEGDNDEEIDEETLCMLNEEEKAVYAQGSMSTGVLLDTIEYDYEMLQELTNSILNKNTKGDLFRIFIEKLDENAEDFYGKLGSNLGDDYKYCYYF